MGKEELRITFIKVDSLKVSEYNSRKHDEEATRQLEKSITEYGLVDPLIVNSAPERKNVLIGGHFRREVAEKLGIKEVPVVYVNIPNIEREQELNLRLNRNVGEWDYELLKEFDLNLLLNVGFSDEDLSQIWDDSLEAEDDNFNTEAELEKIEETDIQLGDLFQLGSHRLLCADAHDHQNIHRLMSGEKRRSCTATLSTILACHTIKELAVSKITEAKWMTTNPIRNTASFSKAGCKARCR